MFTLDFKMYNTSLNCKNAMFYLAQITAEHISTISGGNKYKRLNQRLTKLLREKNRLVAYIYLHRYNKKQLTELFNLKNF